ncbi:MAG: amidohydrolase family protein [Alphaproteobacteria bacterium]
MAGVYDGPFVDAHHHLWRYAPHDYPWLAAPALAAIARDVLPADHKAELARHRVAGSVWIEAVARDPVAEARQAQAWADADPACCNAIVAHCPLDAPDAADGLDTLIAAVPNLRGVRDIVAPPHARRADLLQDPGFARGLAALAARGLSFDLLLQPRQLAAAAAMAARLPDLRVIVEHAASPADRRAEGMALWRDGLARMAALPNVVIKISALHCFDPAWSRASVAADVATVIAAFGVSRCCFATDYPAHDVTIGSAQALDDLKAAVSGCSADEQRALFCDNACRFYRFDLPAPAA